MARAAALMAAKAEPGHPESGKLHQRWRKAKEAGNLSMFASPAELRALVQAKLTPEEQVRFGMQCAGLAAKALEVLDKSQKYPPETLFRVASGGSRLFRYREFGRIPRPVDRGRFTLSTRTSTRFTLAMKVLHSSTDQSA
jgi:hypothetical protein